MFQFYKTWINSFNISTICTDGIIFSSTLFELSSGTDFVFTISSAILFPINSFVAPAALWTTFLVAVFKAWCPIYVGAFINCLLYLLDIFLRNDKNPYPFTCFLFLVPQNNMSSLLINTQHQFNFVFYF